MKTLKPFTLPKLIKFNSSNCSSYSNALHAQFHQTLHDLVKATTPKKWLITADLLDAWKERIDMETDIAEEAKQSALTEALLEKDVERDSYVTHILKLIDEFQRSPLKTMHEAARQLAPIMRVYNGVQREPAEVETEKLNGLELDLAKHSAETATLGLTTLINAMHTANTEYQALRSQRREEAIAADLPAARRVRREADDILEVVQAYVKEAFLQAADDAEKQKMEHLAEQMNRAIDDFRTTFNQREAQRLNNKDKEEEKNRTMLAPFIPALEEHLQLATGSITPTGKTRSVNKRKVFELRVSGRDESLWVALKNKALVEVKIPEKKNGKKPTTPKNGKNNGGKSGGGNGQGSASVTPKPSANPSGEN